MAAGDLTDLESVRQFMQKSANDRAQDTDLEVLITQASLEIQRFCNREFAPAANNIKRSFELESISSGADVLDVTPYEFRTIHGIILDPDLGAGVELKAEQYRPWSYPPRDGTFFGVRLTNLPRTILPPAYPSLPERPFQTRRVDIMADWATETVPSQIKHWANVTVESWVHLRRDGGVGFNEVQLQDAPPARADDLPPAVQWALSQRWIRPTPSA